MCQDLKEPTMDGLSGGGGGSRRGARLRGRGSDLTTAQKDAEGEHSRGGGRPVRTQLQLSGGRWPAHGGR